MRILRWLAVRVLAAGLWLSLSLIATSAILLATILNPSFIKSTIDKSGFYDTVVASGLKLASTNLNDTDDNMTDIIPDLTPIVEKVLTPSLLQTDTEQVIDGIGNWLKGKTVMPEFSIDTSAIQANLSVALADYLNQRVASLPVCPTTYGLEPSDLFTTECRPPVDLTQSDFTTAASDFSSEIPTLGQATINSEDLIKDTGSDAWREIPQAYHWASLTPYIFGVLALLAATLIFVISRSRARALRRIGHIVLANGVILLITGAITSFYIGRNSMDFIISGSSVQQAEFTRETLIPLIQSLATTFGNWLLYFGVSYAILGAICYFGAHWLKLRQKGAKTNDETEQEIATPTANTPSQIGQLEEKAQKFEDIKNPKPEEKSEPTGPPTIKAVPDKKDTPPKIGSM